jgi:heme A synthase
VNGHRLFRALSIVAFGSTYITVLLGANVMASGSGLACPDWPSCSTGVLGTFQGAAGIEFSHRTSAFLLSLIIVGLAILGLAYERRRPVLRNLALAALGLVILEALLGGVVIDSGLAWSIVLVHFAIATLLFGLTLILAFLANLKEIPRRWLDWAHQAAEMRAPVEPLDRPVPAGPGLPAIPGASAAPLDR